MLIKKIKIENFRSLKNIEIECDNLIAILGRNGTGKSSVLYALDKFYDVNAQFNNYDYYNKSTDNEIKIIVTYGNLKENEILEFSTYLQGNELIVTKKVNSGGARYYAVEKQIEEFNEIRKYTGREKTSKYNELIDKCTFPELTEKGKSQTDVETKMQDFEEKHQELCKPFEKETQLFGPPRIGGGKLDKFTKFIFIPAVRDVLDETQRKGSIQQLISAIVERSINNRSDVKEFKEKFDYECKKIYNTNNLPELKELGKLITKNLTIFSPGSELDLEFGEASIPEINIPEAIPYLSEDKFSAPPNYSGHGLQRALIFALLRQLSITQSNKIDIEEGEDNESSMINAVIQIPDLILAIEEPELYLHPSRCRFLSDTLKKLSEASDDSNQPRTQIFYATHSPYFVDLNRFDQVKISRKILSSGNESPFCTLNSYSIKEATDRLRIITEDSTINFNEQSFIARTYPVMTTVVNEGYFSDMAIIVEGFSEVAALWFIQEKLGKRWNELGITIIPAQSKNNIDRPVIIFSGFNIKTFFIFDGDSGIKNKDLISAKKLNRKLMKLGGVEPEDLPKTLISDSFAVFNDKFETEIKHSIGEENFNRIINEVAVILNYDDKSRVLKNIEGTRMVFEKIYTEKMKVKIFDDIVNKITELYKS